MPSLKHLRTAASLFFLVAPTLLRAQETKVATVTTDESTTTWYADPVWIAVGIAVVLLFIILAVRSRGTTTKTTVIR